MEDASQFETREELLSAINNAVTHQEKVNIEVEFRDPTTNEYFMIRVQSELTRMTDTGMRFMKWALGLTVLMLAYRWTMGIFF